MKSKKGIYPRGRLPNVWNEPENITKANISTKAAKGTYPNGRLHNDLDSSEDAIKVNDDMKVRNGIDPAMNCMREQNAPEKKTCSHKKPNSGLNRKNRKSKNQIIRKIKNNKKYTHNGLFISASSEYTAEQFSKLNTHWK